MGQSINPFLFNLSLLMNKMKIEQVNRMSVTVSIIKTTELVLCNVSVLQVRMRCIRVFEL